MPFSCIQMFNIYTYSTPYTQVVCSFMLYIFSGSFNFLCTCIFYFVCVCSFYYTSVQLSDARFFSVTWPNQEVKLDFASSVHVWARVTFDTWVCVSVFVLSAWKHDGYFVKDQKHLGGEKEEDSCFPGGLAKVGVKRWRLLNRLRQVTQSCQVS